jgi:hypothetical protein
VLGSTPDQLEAVKGQVRVKGNSSKALSWKDACAKIGAVPINAHGKNLGGRDPLMNSGVGGVQMADVSLIPDRPENQQNAAAGLRLCFMKRQNKKER